MRGNRPITWIIQGGTRQTLADTADFV